MIGFSVTIETYHCYFVCMHNKDVCIVFTVLFSIVKETLAPKSLVVDNYDTADLEISPCTRLLFVFSSVLGNPVVQRLHVGNH